VQPLVRLGGTSAAFNGGNQQLSTLRSIINAIPGRSGKPDRLDTATRMAMDADLTAKPKAEPKGKSQRDQREAKVDPIEGPEADR
jgi:hypothetical protein